MKKLLVMMSAVALGAFAWADGLLTGEGFDKLEPGALDTSGTAWAAPAGEATLTVTEWGADKWLDERPTLPSEVAADETNFLAVKTTFGDPLTRYVADSEGVTVGDNGLFFDSLVKLTATDEQPDLDKYGDEKLVVYAQDFTEAETPKAETNLMVAAKYIDTDGASSVKHYNLGAIDVDVWHRLTIKMIKMNASEVGFEVFVDKIARDSKETFKSIEKDGYDLTVTARALNNAKKLFPSIASTTSILGVAFDGQGSVDDIAFTDTEPAFAKDSYFEISWDEHVTAVEYTAYGETTTATESPISIPYSEGMTVAINPTFEAGSGDSDGWALKDVATYNCNYDSGVLTASGENPTAMINSKDKTARVYVTIGEGEPVAYPTFAEAIASVESAATLKLNKSVDIGLVEVEEDVFVTEGTIGTKDITIDLNGKTVTGTAEGFEGYVFNAVGGKLTILDGSEGQTGRIVPATGNLGVVYVGSVDEDTIANLDVQGGTFDGLVAVDPGDEDPESGYPAATATIAAGKFLDESAAESFYLEEYIDDDSQLADEKDGDYWVVEPKPTYTISVDAPNATVVINDGEYKSGDAVSEGTELTIIATEDAYYDGETLAITINGAPYTAGDVYEVTADGVAIAVTVDAVKYTVTYTDDEDFVKDDQVFTIANYADQELWDGERPGYVFDDEAGWSDADGNPVEDLAAAIKALIDAGEDDLSLTLSGSWEAEATDVTVTLTKDTGIATIKLDDSEVSEVKGEPGSTVTVTLTAENTIAIPVFKADGTTCGASYEITIPEADDEIVFTAVDAKDAPTDEDAAAALVAAGVDSTAVAKVSSAKALASWWEGAGKGATAADINASNYVKASVDLGVALITDSTVTAVEGETFAAVGDGLTFNIKVGDVAIDAEKAVDYVQATDDLSTWSADNVTKTVNEGAVKVTSTTGKAFAKVVIPTDAQ